MTDDQARPTRLVWWCPDCRATGAADEDGCCTTCGADCEERPAPPTERDPTMTHTRDEGRTRWTKRPVTVEAIRWTGANLRDVIDFTGLHPSAEKWTWDEYERVVADEGLKIFTMEGPLRAEVGDWIIQGVQGEFYPCKPDIFEATYERADDRKVEIPKCPWCEEPLPMGTHVRDCPDRPLRTDPSGDVEEEDVELLEFAMAPLTEMAERGHYWADEVDDEDRVTPEDVIAAITRILARLRRTPETEAVRIVEKHIRHVQASPGASGQRYALRVLDDVRDDLLATQDPNAGG